MVALTNQILQSWTESKTGAKVVTGALHFTSRIKLDNDRGWESLSNRYEVLGFSLFHRIAHNNVQPLLRSFLPKVKDKKYNTRPNDEC